MPNKDRERSSMYLQVRRENVLRLKVLASLSQEQFEELKNVFEQKVATVADPRAVADAVQGLQLTSTAEALGVALATFPLLYNFVAEGHKPRTVAASVIEALRTPDTDELSFSRNELAILRRRLEAILGSHDLTLKAKATALFLNRGAFLVGSKILTDVRPVFSLKSADSIEAFTVLHTLVLEISNDDEERSVRLAVDRSDLAELKKAIERAEEKEKATAKWIGTTGVNRVDIA